MADEQGFAAKMNSMPKYLVSGGLVDEYRLAVYPVILGSGRRLFPEGSARADLRLTGSRRDGETGILTMNRPVPARRRKS
ncbi:MAG: dihydrofolate reductase family protein [Solirubrobacterales bacterium]|nr:dihydrofolate reductase family protein [Solirubrobacterales bacterium]MBV9717220.1 dihydrofolate reductase family protein [Solirubrobacterales bacterium]